MKFGKLLVAALAVLLLSSAAPSRAGEDPRGSLAKIIRTKKLTLNISTAGEPYMFRDKNGNPTGFATDIQKLLAKDLAATLHIPDVDWSGLIPSMLSKKTDFIALHLSYTIERAKVVDFTNPFYALNLVPFVHTDNKDKYTDWRMLNQEGVKIAVIGGTISEATIKTVLYKAEPVVFGNDVDCFQALQAKRVDAHVNGEGLWSMIESNYPGQIFILREPNGGAIASDKMAFATRPEDLFTNRFLNFWLKENLENGKINLLIDYWFNNEDYHNDFKVNAAKGKMSKSREQLVDLLGIADYSPYFGDKYLVVED